MARLKSENGSIRDDIQRFRGTLQKLREECKASVSNFAYVPLAADEAPIPPYSRSFSSYTSATSMASTRRSWTFPSAPPSAPAPGPAPVPAATKAEPAGATLHYQALALGSSRRPLGALRAPENNTLPQSFAHVDPNLIW